MRRITRTRRLKPEEAAGYKAVREQVAGELADLTQLTGMDRSALWKFETGQRANATVEALVRYAEAVGKRLVVSLAAVKEE